MALRLLGRSLVFRLEQAHAFSALRQQRLFHSYRLDRLEAEALRHPRDPRRQLEYLRALNQSDPEAVVERYENLRMSDVPGATQEYMSACSRLGRSPTAVPSSAELLQAGSPSSSPFSLLSSPVSSPSASGAAASSLPRSAPYPPAGYDAFAGGPSSGFAAYPPGGLSPGWAGPYGSSFPPSPASPPSSPQPVAPFAYPSYYSYYYPPGATAAPPAAAAPPSYGEPSLSRGAAEDLVQALKNGPLKVTLLEPSVGSQLWRTVRALLTGLLVLSAVSVFLEDKAGGVFKPGQLSLDTSPMVGVTTRFDDVKGCDEAKGEVMELVQFLKDPQRFTRLGGKLPKGVLLVGPPGTGKTLLAKAIAGEAGVPFFYVNGSEFEEMFVGVGAKRVRELFAAAKRSSPCIIFIDEIDAVGATRNPKDQQYMRMTLNQLLAEMDGFASQEGIIVIGATNFPQALDKALVRPGRFDRHITVAAPDVKGREEILQVHMSKSKVPRDPTVDLRYIARNTPGFTGADLANLVNLSALKAAIDNKDAVSMNDVDWARDRILMGAERKSFRMSLAQRKLTAYHEGGHALVAFLTDGATPIHKATIAPRGQALGMVQQLPKASSAGNGSGDDSTASDGDTTGYTRKQLRAMIDVAMGGRVAEELIFGRDEITTGASSDIEQATNVVREMITRYGMSDRLGPVDYASNAASSGGRSTNGEFVSDQTRKEIEIEIREMVSQSYERVKRLIRGHEKELHALASALLDRETLTGKEIASIIQPPTASAVSVHVAPRLPSPASGAIGVPSGASAAAGAGGRPSSIPSLPASASTTASPATARS